ncbi:hypothetical protein [Cohnella hongkongensis]|uniref:Uncharacterized protein n=1 Tax=Cohnella hongkongensis TaxID=178337 RepID=A0ABV9F9G9_9BACL
MRERGMPILWLVLALLLFVALPPLPAEANMLNRIRDIYKAPDQVDELREQYEETARTLEEQRRKLMEAETSLDSYASEQRKIREENELYRQQNEELMAQNRLLTERLEQLEKDKSDKQALYRKWMTAVGAAVALIAGYVLSIRLWRYSVWRSRKQPDGGI